MREVKWYQERRIILVHLADDVSFDEVKLNNQEIIQLLEQGQAPVHLIFYAQDLKTSPTNIKELRDALSFLKHPNMGWIINIGTNALNNFVSKVVANFFRIKVRSAKDFAEAQVVLQRLDLSLENKPVS